MDNQVASSLGAININKHELAKLEDLLEYVARHELKSHSGTVSAGDIFIALPGTKVDGATFIADAAKRGAFAIVAERKELNHFLRQNPEYWGRNIFCAVDDSRDALATLASHKFNTASLPFPVIGITGTNGKTTITYLFENLYNSVKGKVGVFGTVNYRWPGFEEKAPLTTPDCLKVHTMLAKMRDSGKIDAALLEISSHALAQKRVLGVEFSGAVFTNLTQDHLDFHGDMEHYFQEKTKLFFAPYASRKQIAVINSDDAYGRRILKMFSYLNYEEGRVISYGLGHRPPEPFKGKHLQGEILSSSTAGLHLRMSFLDESWTIKSPLVGNYNALNLLSVQALALNFGFTPNDFKCFEGFSGTPGRLERVPNSKGLHIFVDYAHSPDALINVQRELKKVGFKRLITVFGCGGNRDRTKRPLMGQAVADYADVAILTSDNPRHEDPLAIMDDVRPGLASCPKVIEEINRKKAIELAINITGPDDALLVAGKGHEDYQIIGDDKIPFSDQETIQEILLCR